MICFPSTKKVGYFLIALIWENESNADGKQRVVINTASVVAFYGQMGQSAYSPSKGAIAGTAIPFAKYLASHGIRVLTVASGLF